MQIWRNQTYVTIQPDFKFSVFNIIIHIRNIDKGKLDLFNLLESVRKDRAQSILNQN